MRVATYNIHGAVGLDRRRRPERIVEVIESLDADIIGLQEVEGRRSRSRVDQAQHIGDALDYHLVAGPLLLEGMGGYGNVLLSRHPVLEVERRVYQRPGSQTRGLLDAVVAHPLLGRLRVIVTHLEVRDHRIRATQLRELESLLAEGPEGPAVLMGDLNEWWSRRVALKSLDRTVEHVELYYTTEGAEAPDYAALRQKNAEQWKLVFEEDVFVVEGMQKGRHGRYFDGGKFSPAMDGPTHLFHHWVASQMARGPRSNA